MANSAEQKGLAFLSSNALKWIAVLFMTIDHIAAFGYDIPFIGEHYMWFRIPGRIAAPLFLFVLAESMYHTRSRARLIFRLYCAGVGTGLFTAVTNLFLGETIGLFAPGNIMFTMFYIALIVTIIETFWDGVEQRDGNKIGIAVGGVIAIGIPIMTGYVMDYFGDWIFTRFSASTYYLIQDCYDSFLPNILGVEYGLLFVLMGMLFCFVRDKYYRGMVFTGFCALSFLGMYLPEYEFLNGLEAMIGYPQYFMILALPFMLLYSGEKGRSAKYFFYIYYPVHRYLISVLVVLLGYKN